MVEFRRRKLQKLEYDLRLQRVYASRAHGEEYQSYKFQVLVRALLPSPRVPRVIFLSSTK